MTEFASKPASANSATSCPSHPAPVAAYVPAVTSGSLRVVHLRPAARFVDGVLPATGKVSGSGEGLREPPRTRRSTRASAC